MREAQTAFGDVNRLPRGGPDRAAARRGAAPRRRDRRGRPPVRARLLDPAPPPEGRRGRSRAGPRPALSATRSAATPSAWAGDRLRERRHGRVPRRPGERPARLHRAEPPHPGRAHGHRGDDRRRPRPLAAAAGRRGDARVARADPGADRAARSRAAVPDHDRGSGKRLPPRHGPDLGLPLARRRRDPPRRRHHLRGRRDLGLLRLAARQAHLPGARPRGAVARARRALAEFRIRGVATNLAFLQAVLAEPDFVAGAAHDGLRRRAPAPAAPAPGRGPRDAARVARRRPHRQPAARAGRRPCSTRASKLPPLPEERRARGLAGPAAGGRRDGVRAASCAPATALAVTDTTLRDAHQSLLATRLRTFDMVAAAPHLARLLPGLWSIECWGGATFDVALRFLARGSRGSDSPVCATRFRACSSRCSCAGATPSATRPTRTRSAARSSRRRPRGDRRVPGLRRPQRRRADASRDRGRHRGGRARRGLSLLLGRPRQPGRDAVHARLLPAPRRADRGDRGARPLHQGHGRSAAPPGRPRPRRRPARALRPAGAPAHPRHRGRLARDLPGRDRGGSGRGRRRRRSARGHDEPAEPRRDRGRHRWHRARDRALARGAERARALLAGRTAPVRPVRDGPRRAHRHASTVTRSRAASSRTCARRRRRSGSATASRRSRSSTRPPTGSSGGPSR